MPLVLLVLQTPIKTEAEESKAPQPKDPPEPEEPKAGENAVEEQQKEDMENGGLVKTDAEMEQRAPENTEAATSGEEMHHDKDKIVQI